MNQQHSRRITRSIRALLRTLKSQRRDVLQKTTRAQLSDSGRDILREIEPDVTRPRPPRASGTLCAPTYTKHSYLLTDSVRQSY